MSQTSEGAGLFTGEGSGLYTEKGSGLYTEKGSGLFSGKGSGLFSETGAGLHNDEGSGISTGKGGCLFNGKGSGYGFDLKAAIDLEESDWVLFNRLTSLDLTSEEKKKVSSPGRTDPVALEFLAVHWHPEWAPLELIEERLSCSFPCAENSLVIPTQHNRIMSYGGWAGVEADAYDRRYGQKVQLLLHFQASRLPRATALVAMMKRTYDYRANLLMDCLERLVSTSLVKVGSLEIFTDYVSEEALCLVRFFAARLKYLIERSGIRGNPRGEMLKNRLLSDFILGSCGSEQHPLVKQAMRYIKAVKKTVKAELRPEAFYSPQEIIEETRSLGGGVVIPHPPKFWPILLGDLDVDGWEVWNPSTPLHTMFLLEALQRANEARTPRRRLLAFMGDDTHMSSKIRPELGQNKNSASREIGFQDPWFDTEIATELIRTGQSRTVTINEYQARLTL